MRLRIKSSDIGSLAGRSLFFDTNVLLYLFCPAAAHSSQQWAVKEYSTIFNHSLTAKSTVCIDVTVLSEFINRFLRLEYDRYRKHNGITTGQLSFKCFRSTPDGLRISQDIEGIVRKILQYFQLIGKLFNTSEIQTIPLLNADFNDALIVGTCLEHKCVLVTHDADFLGFNIDILSANNKLTKA